jgi:hypothetical protein
MPTDTMLLDYVHNRTLKLIYGLANYGADAEVYGELLRIAQQAKDDVDSGIDPGDRLADINGQIVEL